MLLKLLQKQDTNSNLQRKKIKVVFKHTSGVLKGIFINKLSDVFLK